MFDPSGHYRYSTAVFHVLDLVERIADRIGFTPETVLADISHVSQFHKPPEPTHPGPGRVQ